MGVRCGRFAADANPGQGLARTPYRTRKINPQRLDGIFNRDSKRIDRYPQAI